MKEEQLDKTLKKSLNDNKKRINNGRKLDFSDAYFKFANLSRADLTEAKILDYQLDHMIIKEDV